MQVERHIGGVDRDPAPAQQNASAAFLTLAGAIAALVIVMWLLRWFVYEAVPAWHYTFLGAIVFVPTAAVAFWRGRVPTWVLLTNFGADIVVVTIGIHYGGGADNVSGPLLYAILIGLAGLIASGRAAFAAAFGSTVLYGALVSAERYGLLTHHLPYTKSGDDAVATVIAVGAYLFLVAWLVSYTVSQIHAVHRRMDELRTEAVSALSHDLKNPLGVISSSAELAASSPAGELPEHLDRIQRGALIALDLVHNVLDAAAVDEHMLRPHFESVDLRRLVADVVALYGAAASAKHVALTTNSATGLPPFRGDVQLLSRALGNLLSNAIKFTPDGGTISIRVEPQGERVAIEVRDSGRGIRPEERARLFRKFTRIDSGAHHQGTGLGLYIVRAIVDAHGGRIRVDSALPTGTVFTIQLPTLNIDSRP